MSDRIPILFGSYQRPVDKKGRLVIPTQLRQGLGSEELIVLKWFDNCLALFPETRWLEIAKTVSRFPSFTQRDRRMRRAFFGSAEPIKPDAQGRIVISPEMREYAFLDDEAVLIGDYDKIEVWSEALYKAEKRNMDAEVNSGYEHILSQVYALNTNAQSISDHRDVGAVPAHGPDTVT